MTDGAGRGWWWSALTGGLIGAVVALPACAGDDGTSVSATTTTVFVATEPDPSEETVLSWPERFCAIQAGMTRAEVQEVMGPPTYFADSTGDGANPQDTYTSGRFFMTIFFYENPAAPGDPMMAVATSLDPDPTGSLTAMTLDDIALFPCADELFTGLYADILDGAAANSAAEGSTTVGG